MRLLVQRVLRATVEVDGFVEGRVGAGLVLSLCLNHGDSQDAVESLAEKALQLNLWPEMTDLGKPWKTNVVDNGYEVLVVLQPSLGMGVPGQAHDEAESDETEELFGAFVSKLRAEYQEEMVVAAPMDKNITLEVTSEGQHMFDLDPEKRRSARQRVLEATTKAAMSGGIVEELDPTVPAVTGVLERIPRMSKSKATLESCRVFRVLSQKAFQAAFADSDPFEADAFAEALDGAGAFFTKTQQEQISKWTGMKISATAAAGGDGDMDLDAQLSELQEEVTDPLGARRKKRERAEAAAAAAAAKAVKGEPELEDDEEPTPPPKPTKQPARHHPDWQGRAAPDTSTSGQGSKAAAAARAWVQSRSVAQGRSGAPAGDVAGANGWAPGGKAAGKGKYKGPRPPRRAIGGIASLDHCAALHGTASGNFHYGQLARYSEAELRFQQAQEEAGDELFDEDDDAPAKKRARPAVPKLPKGVPTVAPMCPEVAPGEEL